MPPSLIFLFFWNPPSYLYNYEIIELGDEIGIFLENNGNIKSEMTTAFKDRWYLFTFQSRSQAFIDRTVFIVRTEFSDIKVAIVLFDFKSE